MRDFHLFAPHFAAAAQAALRIWISTVGRRGSPRSFHEFALRSALGGLESML